MISFENSSLLRQAKEAKMQPKLIVQILLFFVVFLISNTISSSILTVAMVIGLVLDPEFMTSVSKGDVEATMGATEAIGETPMILLLSLFATVITTLACIFYCCKIEKRSLGSMGLGKSGWFVRYLKGYAIGTAMLFLCALILWLLGEMDFAFAENISLLYVAAFFVGFLIQGMSEEVLVRGYFMISLTNRCHTALAVGISSLAFAVLHLANAGITLLAFANLTLFGVFMGVYILRSRDLWGACAIHSAWNFAQGNLLGIRVSGTTQLPTVAVMNPIGEQALLHGGDFGLEGGLIVTLILLAAISLTLLLPQKTTDQLQQSA